jgi:chromosome partitioning protein
MQTIVLATQKGGSGKSTLAISLALAAIRAGHTVRLIETDPQGTVSNWKRRRPYAAPVIEPIYAAREVEQRLQSLVHDGVTVTIVDTAGGETAATNSAIRYSDFCLIPTRPSIADIEATAATLRVIRAWHKPFAYVLNQTPIRAAARLAGAENALGDEAALDAAEILAKPFIVMRNDHQDALSAGLAVCEHAPGGKSAEEMRALWQWVESRLGNAVAAPEEPIIEEFAKYPQLFLSGLRSRLSTLTALTSSEHLPEADTPAPRSVIREEPCDDLSAEAQRAKAEAIRTASPAGLLRFATTCGAASSPASRAIFPRASDHCDGQARCSRQVRRRSFA